LETFYFFYSQLGHQKFAWLEIGYADVLFIPVSAFDLLEQI